jgi:hypothetical protein
VNLVAGEAYEITNGKNGRKSLVPDVSPGRVVVFSADFRAVIFQRVGKKYSGIWMIRPDGTNETLVGCGADPIVAPDLSSIVYNVKANDDSQSTPGRLKS